MLVMCNLQIGMHKEHSCHPPESRASNVTQMFFIPLVFVSAQRMGAVCQLIDFASSTDFGRGRPNLLVFFKCFT